MAGEGLGPGQGEIGGHAHGVLVSTMVKLAAHALLRRHVGWGAHGQADRGQVGVVFAASDILGEAEVGDLGYPILSQQDVIGFDVAMDGVEAADVGEARQAVDHQGCQFDQRHHHLVAN